MYPFFAYLNRLKLINRWSLMRNTQQENDAEHSLQVAMIAHAIAVIGKERYGRDIDPEHVLALAVYHDVTEVMTGDLPTPVKYYSGELRNAYRKMEEMAADRLLTMLPDEMREEYTPYLKQDEGPEHRIVKAADRIAAWIKCTEEKRAGNHEFDYAAVNVRKSIEAEKLPEVQDFLNEYLPAYELTLDELNNPRADLLRQSDE